TVPCIFVYCGIQLYDRTYFGKLNHTADILSRNISNIKLCPSFLPDVIEDQRLHDPKLLNFKVKPYKM
ncbi:Putative LOC100708214, partial [Caligus rogercresseyi]